jgi:hypothetical protein
MVNWGVFLYGTWTFFILEFILFLHGLINFLELSLLVMHVLYKGAVKDKVAKA